MPHTFERTFKIRYYECDPYGYVNHANYLRYAIQAVVEANASGGHDMFSGEAQWFLREAGLEFLQPLPQGEVLTVRTWMSNWRNEGVSLEQVFLAGPHHEAAKVYTDWDFLTLETLEPVPTSTRVLSAFFPGGVPGESSARPPFPKPPPEPGGAFTARRGVRWHQLNPWGAMDSAHYVSLIEEVTLDAAEYAGWSMQKADDYHVAYFAKAHHIEYLRPAVMGDELRIKTYIGSVAETSCVRHYLIDLADGQSVARAQTDWVWVDPETGRPVPIPGDWLEDFSDQIAEVE